MAELPEHSHCLFCGDPVAYGEQFCSEDCAGHYAKKKKKDFLKENGFYIIAAIGIIVLSVILWMMR